MREAERSRFPFLFPWSTGTAFLALLAALALAVGGCGGGKDDKAEPPARTLVPAAMPAADSTALAVAAADAGAVADTVAAGPVDEAMTPPPARATTSRTAPPRTTDLARQAAPGGTFSLQLGSYRNLDNARAQAARIEALGYTPVLESAVVGGQTHHRVLLRGLADRAEAARVGERLRTELGITYLIRQSD